MYENGTMRRTPTRVQLTILKQLNIKNTLFLLPINQQRKECRVAKTIQLEIVLTNINQKQEVNLLLNNNDSQKVNNLKII